jgi:hypothetical protein
MTIALPHSKLRWLNPTATEVQLSDLLQFDIHLRLKVTKEGGPSVTEKVRFYTLKILSKNFIISLLQHSSPGSVLAHIFDTDVGIEMLQLLHTCPVVLYDP